MKYVLQRILIGVGIFLAITFIRKNVFALSVSSVKVSSDDATQVISSLDRTAFFGSNWAIWQNSSGYVLGTFSVQKVGGTSTSSVITPRYVFAASNSDFSCNVGTTSVNNSTYVSQTYTYICPVSLGSNGLKFIQVGFDGWQSNDQSTFRVEFNNNITLYNEYPNVNIDTSSITQSQQATTNAINNQTTTLNNAINNVSAAAARTNQLLESDSVTGATSTGESFFSGFQSDSHGISGVVTAPIRLVNAFTTESCSPLTFTLPFVHNQVTLQCMKPIYQNYFGTFFTLYQLITTGVLAYMVMINLFARVHDLQNPNNDRIAVLSL